MLPQTQQAADGAYIVKMSLGSTGSNGSDGDADDMLDSDLPVSAFHRPSMSRASNSSSASAAALQHHSDTGDLDFGYVEASLPFIAALPSSSTTSAASSFPVVSIPEGIEHLDGKLAASKLSTVFGRPGAITSSLMVSKSTLPMATATAAVPLVVTAAPPAFAHGPPSFSTAADTDMDDFVDGASLLTSSAALLSNTNPPCKIPGFRVSVAPNGASFGRLTVSAVNHMSRPALENLRKKGNTSQQQQLRRLATSMKPVQHAVPSLSGLAGTLMTAVSSRGTNGSANEGNPSPAKRPRRESPTRHPTIFAEETAHDIFGGDILPNENIDPAVSVVRTAVNYSTAAADVFASAPAATYAADILLSPPRAALHPLIQTSSNNSLTAPAISVKGVAHDTEPSSTAFASSTIGIKRSRD
jgi:hypothetical protein